MERRILLTFSALLAIKLSFAQCSMYELSLADKIENASVVFEGKVVSKQCFWNSTHNLIYTSNSVEVYKIFKGSISQSSVELITEGGEIGNEKHEILPNLVLEIGDVGLFFTNPISKGTFLKNAAQSTSYECYGAGQGFYEYNLQTNTAIAPFVKYNDIGNELYPDITSITGEDYLVVKNIEKSYADSFRLKSGGTISGFNPTTISGGTNSVLTISGSGFGSTRGTSYVGFTNANDGGATFMEPLDYHYVSWSDTEIKVKVPAKTTSGGAAGTGPIQVVVSGTPINNSTNLIVDYSETNTSGAIPYQTSLVTVNASGGITWQMNTDFESNTLAKDAFVRAMENWTANTQINWVLGSTTTKDEIVRDSINVVRFDIGNELPSGTLARCYYYWLGCPLSLGAPASEWFVSELDMAVDDGTAWAYGPEAPLSSEYDLETVLLHELGHGHQLGHVIEVLDPLHFSVLKGTTKRVLTAGNIAGGTDIMSRSFANDMCGYPAMTPLVISVGLEDYLALNDKFSIYPNPGSGVFTVDIEGREKPSEISAYNHLGDKVKTFSSFANTEIIYLDLSDLSKGVYTLVLDFSEEILSKKIVVL